MDTPSATLLLLTIMFLNGLEHYLKH